MSSTQYLLGRSLLKKGVGRRKSGQERQSLAQGCPWSLPSQRPFPGGPLGPTTSEATPGNQDGQEGGFTVLAGVQDGEARLRDGLWLSPLAPRDRSCFLALSTRSPWRWEEEELVGDLGVSLRSEKKP